MWQSRSQTRRLTLVKASVAGDWFPNTCMAMSIAPSVKLDVDGFYAILGLDTWATDAEIKSAAKRRMLETHPDVGGDESEFEMVLKAYKTLSDSSKRAAYDAEQKYPKSSMATAYVITATATEAPAIGRACFYKGISDMLTEDDVESAYAWQEMVIEAAHEIGASFEVEVGVSDKVDRYVIQDGIAVKPSKSKPNKTMAKAYVLYKMSQK